MKPRFILLAAAALSFAFCAPASAAVHTNLFENFSTIDAEWGAKADTYKLLNGATAETALAETDVSGWTGIGLVFKAPSCIRLGNSGTKGTVFSPVIRLSDKAITPGSATLSFHAAKTASAVGVNTAANVTVLNTDGTTATGISVYAPKHLVDCSSLDNIDTCYTNTDGVAIQNVYTGLPNEFRLQFESSAASDGRVAIDAILVVQSIRDTLDTPNLALSGTAGSNDFAVAWNGVTGAQGYSVKVLDANNAVVSSNDVSSATTTASFTGLTSSSEYTVVVVALGNHTTTDDSAPATLTVETAASAAAAPTLVVANTSWTAGVAGTSAVTAMLEGDVACAFESVTMSDGSTATVANGTLSWTPPISATASSVTATFHVSHDGESWYVDQVLSVAATPAPSAPAIEFSNVTRRAFNATWSSSAGGPVASYKVRAWSGRATPDDATGEAGEGFEDYLANGTVPSGWTFMNSHNPYDAAQNPVDFRSGDAPWISSPDYGGNVTSVSFRTRNYSANGTFVVFAAKSGSEEWTEIASYSSDEGAITTGTKSLSLSAADGYSKFKFQFMRTSGGVSFGSFSVSGTDWPAADFFAGWGGAKVSVGSATSQTFSNPVAGTANYVEVTAIGPTGLATSAIRSVDIPHAPGGVISVK